MQLHQIPAHYDRAAPAYDRLTDLVFGRLLGIETHRRTAIDRLGSLEGATVLDLGCGTGRNFPLLVPRVGPRGRVIGLDYSAGMLEQARRRLVSHGRSNVDLVRADAAGFHMAPGSVDAVVSVWCLGIVHDLEAALTRTLEALRPGGRLAIVDFGRARPDRGLLRWLYPIYSALLQRAGIDTAEDLDDARLRARWRRGRELLRGQLRDYEEGTYLRGLGLVISGRKPPASGGGPENR